MRNFFLHMPVGHRYLIGGLFLVLLVSGVAFFVWKGRQPSALSGGQTIPIQGGGTSVQSGGNTAGSGQSSQASVRLSEGQAQPQKVAQIPLAEGLPLTPEQIQQILARLPTPVPEPGSQVEFKLPAEVLPPPRPGQTVSQPFPPSTPPITAPPVATGPLQVLRYSPEGEIPIAPFIDITFNQPMVALGTLAQLAAQQVPVRIEPDLPGTWRWLGTKTLNFQSDSDKIDRLPKATIYKVTIPAGTSSATGGVLAQTVEWSFSTPPPKVVSSEPSTTSSQPRDPLFFIAFDQRINPAAVLETIHVTAAGKSVPVELVSEDKIQPGTRVSDLVKYAEPGRWLAFKATQLLPADTDIAVGVGPGTPSAEGPLVTQAEQSYSFHTYAPLKVVDHNCNGGNEDCPPLTPFYIHFNNPIDTQVYSEDMLKITPELPGASVNIYGDTISIQGATTGRTTYTVQVAATLQDVFGQKLGEEVRVSFQVGPAQPVLVGTGDTFITLDPDAKKPVFSVYTINYSKLDVKIYAVQPSDWLKYKAYLVDFQRTDVKAIVPGRLVFDKSIPVESQPDDLAQVDIDLGQVMDGPFGHFIVVVSPPQALFKNNDDLRWKTVQAWVQVTQIGLDAFNDATHMVLWATALKDGTPLSDVSITLGSAGTQAATTGADGITRLDVPASEPFLIARKGADQALLARSPYAYGDDAWSQRKVLDELRWYVFDDRQMYRPGEEVHIKGWLRRIGNGLNGDVSLVGNAVTAVSYQVIDSQGNEIGNGQVDTNALGGFDFTFTVPAQVNLGYTQIQLNAVGSLGDLQNPSSSHSIQVQEFRRPEFEVTARNETTGPYFAGGNAVVAVEAKYYAGGALPNADVTWQVSTTPGSYSPPNWPDFTFGTWTPWWGGNKYDLYYPGGGSSKPSKIETFTGKTDATGTHYLRLDFGGTSGPRPLSVVAEGLVMDVNRQAWVGTTTLLVHPASVYVGLRGHQIFVERGTPLKVDFIVTDLDGNPVIDRLVEVRTARMEWKYRNGNWTEEEADMQTCRQGAAQTPVTCTFETPLGGTYQITAVVTDAQGRQNQSQLTRWVSGGKLPPSRKVEQEQVTLIPDRQTYQPGDVAHILVQSPFSPAEGLLTVSRNGIVYTQRFQIAADTTTLEVPIEEKYIPNLNIQVDLTGSTPRTDDQGATLPDVPARPAYASGILNLSIPPVQRTLKLQATLAQTELEPGGETSLDVVLKDANGQPVSGAELAVVVVDEAILALSNYELADPLATFYAIRPADLESVYSRASIVLMDPVALAHSAPSQVVATESALALYGGMPAAMPTATAAPGQAMNSAKDGSRASGAATQPIRIRSDFNPLAVFAPAVTTGADGTARVAVKVPDNLTRYRVMVMAVDSQGNRFGTTETNLTARLPLMVRPSAPRFLNFGDQFDLPVVVQNQTAEPMLVDVAVSASNITFTSGQGQRVNVPAHDRVEVRFPATTQMAGTAHFQIAAVSGNFADAATVELPVYTPATTEAFATYGVVDEGAVSQPLSAPTGVFPQYGGLEITTSSTALQALTDAILYLVSYPYECTEQISSRVLAIAALRDVLTAFKANGLPAPAELEASVQKDIATLQSLQNNDGGMPYWSRDAESIPFNTIHVTHALVLAQAKGFIVPPEMMTRLLQYLREIETHYPTWYSQHTRQTLSAYALYVRNLASDRDPDKALRLLNEAGLENLSLDAIGWLWPVLEDASNAGPQLDAIRRYVNNHTVETAGAANFTTDYDDQNYLLLGSNRRTDAILLDALIGDNPQSDLIPKVVNGLLAQRTRGAWSNTQENVFVLLALDRYFNTFEAQTPEFVARIWLGDTYAGSHTYSGRSTDRQETDIPMSYLVDTQAGTTKDLILSKDGTGRLYYRLGLRYAPTDLTLAPLDMGFVVQRTYEALDDPKDVTLDQDGVWHIKAGARVRVHITMVTDNRRYHVALVDPLPAGLEIVNPAMAVSGSVPQDPAAISNRPWWWWGTWFEHQNLRDDHAEAFTTLLWDGVYQYTYIARATTPGRFIVPPAKAEEMYSPEVFGRSGSNIVVVE